MIHHCPLCGTELKLWINENPFSLEESAGIFAYGCSRCCLALNGPCSYDLSKEEKEAFAEALYPGWLDSIDRSELVRTMKTENVLRAAYGMKEVNASDVAFRGLKRKIDAPEDE